MRLILTLDREEPGAGLSVRRLGGCLGNVLSSIDSLYDFHEIIIMSGCSIPVRVTIAANAFLE